MSEPLWTEEQCECLNAFQTCGHMHPFTCGREHSGERVLVATAQGWVCPEPGCDYTQGWAHPFMFEVAPPHPFATFLRSQSEENTL